MDSVAEGSQGCGVGGLEAYCGLCHRGKSGVWCRGFSLTEFDVFVRPTQQRHTLSPQYDLPYDRMQKADQEENTTLLALAVAVKICPPNCRRELLLGLATVLASAEGDTARVDLLKATNRYLQVRNGCSLMGDLNGRFFIAMKPSILRQPFSIIS